jgi:hypothetical protein
MLSVLLQTGLTLLVLTSMNVGLDSTTAVLMHCVIIQWTRFTVLARKALPEMVLLHAIERMYYRVNRCCAIARFNIWLFALNFVCTVVLRNGCSRFFNFMNVSFCIDLTWPYCLVIYWALLITLVKFFFCAFCRSSHCQIISLNHAVRCGIF